MDIFLIPEIYDLYLDWKVFMIIENYGKSR